MKKKQRPLSSSHPREKIKKELASSEKKIEFPAYNPLPQRKEEMPKKLKRVANFLKYKEKIRNAPQPKDFSAWENRDRFSYRKTS